MSLTERLLMSYELIAEMPFTVPISLLFFIGHPSRTVIRLRNVLERSLLLMMKMKEKFNTCLINARMHSCFRSVRFACRHAFVLFLSIDHS